MPWPKKGNKAFATVGNGKAFRLNDSFWKYPQHADAFLKAAEMVIAAYEDDRRDMDDLFFPVAYLYRHCLELKLKDLVRVGIDLRFFQEAKVRELLGGHDLAKLWNQVKKLLDDAWPGADQSPVKGIEAVVNEFHQSDRDGQAFRYPADKSGKRHRHEKLPKAISLTTLRKTMEGVYRMLDSSHDFFHNYLSSLSEQYRGE